MKIVNVSLAAVLAGILPSLGYASDISTSFPNSRFGYSMPIDANLSHEGFACQSTRETRTALVRTPSRVLTICEGEVNHESRTCEVEFYMGITLVISSPNGSIFQLSTYRDDHDHEGVAKMWMDNYCAESIENLATIERGREEGKTITETFKLFQPNHCETNGKQWFPSQYSLIQCAEHSLKLEQTDHHTRHLLYTGCVEMIRQDCQISVSNARKGYVNGSTKRKTR